MVWFPDPATVSWIFLRPFWLFGLYDPLGMSIRKLIM